MVKLTMLLIRKKAKKIDCLIVKRSDALSSVIEKSKELSGLVHETEDLDAACKNLEQWLQAVTKQMTKLSLLLKATLIRSLDSVSETHEP